MPTLQLNTYKPNTADPRVRRKIQIILDWAMPKLNLDVPFHCHRDTLTKVFGNQSSNQLGKFLRANILREVSASFKPMSGNSPGICKTYRISESGFNKVCALLQGQIEVTAYESKSRQFSIAYARERYHAELHGTKPFEYEEKSFRLYHELQGFKRDLKRKIFDGWHDYDISTAMPAIFLSLHKAVQHSRWVNAHVLESMSSLPSLEEYVNNKIECRNRIAENAGIPVETAKQLVNGMFLGMKLVPHHTCAAFKLLGFNIPALNRLRSDPFVAGLQRDIRKFWCLTAKRINRERRLGGQAPIKPSLLYFYHEKIVLDVVRNYLDRKGFTYFLEHDGFRVRERIDCAELGSEVKAQSGFELVWEEA